MISVCLASYNGIDYIYDQVESIINQLREDDELIISDDGSNDGTVELISSIAENDHRIILLHGPQKGLVKNFENALNHATGKFIFLSDQDDIWHPNKVEVFLTNLEKNLLVVSDCNVVDKEMNVISNSFFEFNGLRRNGFSNLIRNSYLGCCMAFQRELLDIALPFPENVPMHDWWLGTCASAKGNVQFLDERLLSYRRHGSNASSTSEKSKYSIFEKLNFRIFIVLNLVKRLFYGS